MILDSTITLQAKTTSYDSEGMPVDIWATSAYIRANIQPNNKSHYFIKEYSNSDASYEFVIFTEVNSLITVGKRLVDGSDTYDIMRVQKWPNHYEVFCSIV